LLLLSRSASFPIPEQTIWLATCQKKSRKPFVISAFTTSFSRKALIEIMNPCDNAFNAELTRPYLRQPHGEITELLTAIKNAWMQVFE
jgi:hypothetical protein